MRHFKTQPRSVMGKVSLMIFFLLTIEGCNFDVSPHLGRDAYTMKEVPAGIAIVPMEKIQGKGYCHNDDDSFTVQDFTIDARRIIRVGGEFKFKRNQIKVTKSFAIKALVPGKTKDDPLVNADSFTFDENVTIETGPIYKPPDQKVKIMDGGDGGSWPKSSSEALPAETSDK